MSDARETFRHGLAAGGFAMLAGLGLLLLVFGAPDGGDPESVATVVALALVGLALLLAGLRERTALGVVTVPWNRLAALGLGFAALYLGAGGAVAVVEGSATVWSLTLLVVVPYFAWLAFECWVGGRYMDRETFAVE
ncbi:hypothetical protein [Salinilacihabitans rarus]|uniref:hypothetical protein n=1 Tax=Salinilacihabitans rarus TaxID=2961596 RepID=UPI0020C88802|nr:hypothetical protein [Salinilacihabitans rarus]